MLRAPNSTLSFLRGRGAGVWRASRIGDAARTGDDACVLGSWCSGRRADGSVGGVGARRGGARARGRFCGAPSPPAAGRPHRAALADAGARQLARPLAEAPARLPPRRGRPRLVALAVVALACAGAAAEEAARVPVDAVAAVIERRVVTRSEIEAEARLVLLERAGPEAASGVLDRQLLGAVLDSVVAQELLALEARRTGVAVREIDIDKTVGDVRAHVGDAAAARAFLQRFGIDDELLRARARRDLAAGALLRKLFSDIKVSDAEADAWRSNHKELPDRAAARLALEKQRKDARFASVMHRLKSEVEVRVVWHP